MTKLGIRGFDVGLEMSGAPAAFNEMITHMYKEFERISVIQIAEMKETCPLLRTPGPVLQIPAPAAASWERRKAF